jgi:pimeloyl-ACP methyl ester carboxylesterase
MLHAYMTTQELGTFSVKMLDNPPLNTTTDAFNRAYAQFKSFAPVAETRLQDIGPYVNTPFAARDMLAITRAHGFDKVKYWGISYGTVLGERTAY